LTRGERATIILHRADESAAAQFPSSRAFILHPEIFRPTLTAATTILVSLPKLLSLFALVASEFFTLRLTTLAPGAVVAVVVTIITPAVAYHIAFIALIALEVMSSLAPATITRGALLAVFVIRVSVVGSPVATLLRLRRQASKQEHARGYYRTGRALQCTNVELHHYLSSGSAILFKCAAYSS
jgi:hypothetical protein